MREMTVTKVMTVYREFLNKFGKIDFSKRPSKYISYDERTMIFMINQLFSGDEQS